MSCKKKGCTTSYAINFDANAEKDDKSCTYYYKLEVSGVRVLDFPLLDPNGEEWDLGSLPDINIRFTDSKDGIKYQTEVKNEVGFEDTIYFSFPSYASVDTLTSNTQFKIYEVDDVSAELIEKFPVNFKDYMHESLSGKEKYPDSIIFNGNSLNMWLYLKWIE